MVAEVVLLSRLVYRSDSSRHHHKIQVLKLTH